MMFKVEVIADSSGKWCGNGLEFSDLDQAKRYADDLMWRWTLVRDWRVVTQTGNVAASRLDLAREA
jgi:hypothetical protein